MNSKTIKVILGILIFITLILIMIIISIKSGVKHQKDAATDFVEEYLNINSIEKVTDYRKFYTVTNLIAGFYGSIGFNEETSVKNILSKEYLKTNSIEQILNSIQSEEPIVTIDEMYMKNNEKEYIYYIYGNVMEYLDSDEAQDIYLKLYIDENNMAYEIYPLNENQYNKIIEKQIEEETKNITPNSDNTFTYLIINEKTRATSIFNNYKQLMQTDLSKAYDKIDDEYKNKRFGNIDNFKKYINSNMELDFSILSKYELDESSGFTEYICQDQNDNVYIFKETAVMEYTVMFDDYIVGTEKFKEQYNGCTDQQKVIVNIDRIRKALNDKNYYYIYNALLSEGFKKNYFTTLEDFESYAKRTFFETNDVEYKDFNETSNAFTYEISITNDESSEEVIEKTIIMKLNDGTDFEFSFDVN